MKIGIVGSGPRAKLYHDLITRSHPVDYVFTTNTNISFANTKTSNFIQQNIDSVDLFFVISKLGTNLLRAQCVDALNKIIMVEKPLFMLDERYTFASNQTYVMYNRRFYNTVSALKEHTQKHGLKSINVSYNECSTDKKNKYNKIEKKNRGTIFFVHLLDIVQYITSSYGDVELIWKSQKKDAWTGMCNCVLRVGDIEIFVNVYSDSGASTFISGQCQNDTFFELAPLETLKIYEGVSVYEESGIRKYKRNLITNVEESGNYSISKMIDSIFSGDYTNMCTIDQEKNKTLILESITT